MFINYSRLCTYSELMSDREVYIYIYHDSVFDSLPNKQHVHIHLLISEDQDGQVFLVFCALLCTISLSVSLNIEKIFSTTYPFHRQKSKSPTMTQYKRSPCFVTHASIAIFHFNSYVLCSKSRHTEHRVDTDRS
ncbi:hypothetical protein C8Q75DRAFT_546365 [Abortiporus biennis]|nr:hypothetical protein C8Q75DRAFT_546365 [Abortiporus biennis]